MTSPHYLEPPREQYSLFDTTMPLRDEGEVEKLPESARELIEVIGLNATIDLIKDYPGDELKIPTMINGASRVWEQLVESIGPQDAEKLVARYKGTMLYVPTCRMALLAHRNREIIRRFDAGEPFDAIRRDIKVSRRHMYRLLKLPG